ncbi:chemotaxis response regulator protein-glutamate methylesterase [Melioribacteraceae bacterium 4301-Me]|uniref:protein-glutamate methylesterase/protein-glutamine glutaminase n=1 Tax=Pyranulibacter aquaticus TaxID=3163344 RepID=UPI00359AE001
MNNKIKVLIVDDSAFMRKSLTLMLESDDSIEIIDTARDGLDALEKVQKYRPDVVTLDIEMPKMDGLTVLKKIMSDFPTPVLMVSSLTEEGAESTIKALELGAVDFIPKGKSFVNIDFVKLKEEIIYKVKSIAHKKKIQETYNRINKLSIAKPSQKLTYDEAKIGNNFKAVCIGISTGGPFTLQKLLPQISPKLLSPIFIVQHMPPKFTASLANRLNSLCQLEVKEGENLEIVKKGTIYIAPGGKQMMVAKNSKDEIVINISDYPNDTLHKPSVDVLFESAADIYKSYLLSVVMTGMGRDGTKGVEKIKKYGGKCIAQDEESCVVYGMPKSVVEAGLADAVAPLEKIPNLINMGA